MTGVARHVLLSVRKRTVDTAHHHNHSASDLLRLLFIRGAVPFDVAVVARSLVQESERLYETLHRRRKVRATKNLDVLATAATSWRPSSTSRRTTTTSWLPSSSCTTGAARVTGNRRSRTGALAAS